MVQPLLQPGSHIEFIPSPALLLAPFNIYDREKSMGLELAAYDPNDPGQLRQLLDLYFIPLWNQSAWTAEHKVALFHSLHCALQDPQYDFARLLEDDDSDCFYLPGNRQIQNPGQLFLIAHTAMQAHWAEVPASTPPSAVNWSDERWRAKIMSDYLQLCHKTVIELTHSAVENVVLPLSP